MHPTLHMLAVRATAAGGLGAASMALYEAALRHLDWALVPSSAVNRVRWWSRHASFVLRMSLALLLVGLAVLAST